MKRIDVMSVLILTVSVLRGAHAGPLTPPAGAPASTMKTLAEVEPRIPITSATTPGDADALFRITQSGSYYLTGNVSGTATQKCIEVFIGANQNVTIDLNGFTLTGTGATSTLPAIYIDGVGAHVTVRNGGIVGWRGAIQHFLGGSIAVEDVYAALSTIIQFDLRNATVVRCHAFDGNSSGFFVDGGTLVDCTARNNSSSGFTINSAATIVRGCSAIGNSSTGFNLGQGVAENCRSELNGSTGFANPGAIHNCTAISNSGDGIAASFSATIRGCTSVANGGDGIQVSSGSRVEGNNVTSNSAHGVNITGSRNSIISNTIASNGRATGSFSGINAAGADNTIDSNNVSDMAVGANDFGIRTTVAGCIVIRNTITGATVAIDLVAGTASGGISTTPASAGAWSNLSF